MGRLPVCGCWLAQVSAWCLGVGVEQQPERSGRLGCLVAAIGILALSRADATSPFVLTAVGYVLAGAGFGVIVPGVTHVATRDVPPGVSGAASGVVNASRQLGTSVGLAVLGSIGVTVATSHWQTAIHRFPATIRAVATGQTQNVAGAHISAVTQTLGHAYRHAAVQSFVHGYHLAVGIAAAFVLAAAVAALIGFRRPTAKTTFAAADVPAADHTGATTI